MPLSTIPSCPPVVDTLSCPAGLISNFDHIRLTKVFAAYHDLSPSLDLLLLLCYLSARRKRHERGKRGERK